jgi:hypothetical protein
MKAAGIMFLVLIGFLFADMATATERIVVAEMFTNTS